MRWALVVMVLVASTALVSSTKSPFTERDKAFYADEATINFVRPGLVMKITGVNIASDGTVTANFTLADPKGVPLDRDGIFTPGPVSSSFLIATIPSNSKFYQNYNFRPKTSTYPPTVGKKVNQAGTDSGGTYTKVADGQYTYKFATKLPSGFDKTATHSVAIYGSRNLSEFDMGTNYATNIFTFVPDGSAVKKVRDVMESTSCNKCHDNLSFHGGSRIGVELCIMCHTPAYTTGSTTVQNTNPETDNTIDLTQMVHKIHMGSSLTKKPYQIVGHSNIVSDWSNVGMPSTPNNCAWCHEQGNDAATQKNNYLTQPTRAACGACHDNVNFATGENHVNLPQPSDNQCAGCHIPQGELDFDASIKGAHVVPQASSLVQGAVVKITSITNATPGQKPIIQFSLNDRAGHPLAMTDIIPGAGRGRLAFTLAGPTSDYGTGIKGTGTNGYFQDNLTATSAQGAPGLYTYTFSQPIPAGSKGTWVFATEGRTDEKLLAGTLKQQVVEVNIPNDVKYFSVDATDVVPRRVVVKTETCNVCHYRLALHGENRNELTNCVICHNPAMTDAARRPADKKPDESISMASMIHRIHTGSSQPRDFTIYGFGNSANNFNDITFPPPATVKKCIMCHVDGTQGAPAPGVLPVTDPRGWLTPVATTSAACLACHASKDAASHALANTTTLGESCAACHGANSEFSVAKVHAQ